jgi:hypothetical protein
MHLGFQPIPTLNAQYKPTNIIVVNSIITVMHKNWGLLLDVGAAGRSSVAGLGAGSWTFS